MDPDLIPWSWEEEGEVAGMGINCREEPGTEAEGTPTEPPTLSWVSHSSHPTSSGCLCLRDTHG